MNRFLITCCYKKNEPLGNPENKSITDLSFNDCLKKYREFIEKANKLNKIDHLHSDEIEIDWNNVAPAWQVYNGKLYSQISNKNWENWKDTNGNVQYEILILTPLYGWIKHTDYIPKYSLDMKDNIQIEYNNKKQKIKLWEFWLYITKNILKPNANCNYYDSNDVDLLSFSIGSPYRAAIGGKKSYNNYVRRFKPLTSNNYDTKFLNMGQGADFARGRKLNELLNKINNFKVENFTTPLEEFDFIFNDD